MYIFNECGDKEGRALFDTSGFMFILKTGSQGMSETILFMKGSESAEHIIDVRVQIEVVEQSV